MKVNNRFHLTYCTNIHPGEAWEEVQANLTRFLPEIRRRVCPDERLGVGLRLSARAAQALENPEQLRAFQDFLEASHCYAFTINGFPYGVFHGTRVKEQVYLPDWKDPRRLEYTNRLASVLARLLPEEEGIEGSVSTVPGAFKGHVHSPEDVEEIARLILQHAAFLHRLREETGKTITLALEPEPLCYLETVDEAVEFFQTFLAGPRGLEIFGAHLELPLHQLEAILRRHVGICYDACHMAVEFEDSAAALRKLREGGVKIAKVQVSSALRIEFESGEGRAEELLRPFAEDTYLHQVVQRSSRGLERYRDLPEALLAESRAGRGETKEWRIHFHVPVFLEGTSDLGTTQEHLVDLLNLLKGEDHCPYLEVETYTWDVIPTRYRELDKVAAISRELEWVRDRLVS